MEERHICYFQQKKVRRKLPAKWSKFFIHSKWIFPENWHMLFQPGAVMEEDRNQYFVSHWDILKTDPVSSHRATMNKCGFTQSLVILPTCAYSRSKNTRESHGWHVQPNRFVSMINQHRNPNCNHGCGSRTQGEADQRRILNELLWEIMLISRARTLKLFSACVCVLFAY